MLLDSSWVAIEGITLRVYAVRLEILPRKVQGVTRVVKIQLDVIHGRRQLTIDFFFFFVENNQTFHFFGLLNSNGDVGTSNNDNTKVETDSDDMFQ